MDLAVVESGSLLTSEFVVDVAEIVVLVAAESEVAAGVVVEEVDKSS